MFRIRGSVPASNYILIPKTSSQSLGLTGRYLYLLFRPCPNKHFVVHLDVAAEVSALTEDFQADFSLKVLFTVTKLHSATRNNNNNAHKPYIQVSMVTIGYQILSENDGLS